MVRVKGLLLNYNNLERLKLKFTSKKSVNNYFVLYDSNDEVVCYFDNFEELSKYVKYRYRDLVYEFNIKKTNVIKVIIDNKKYELAIFC